MFFLSDIRFLSLSNKLILAMLDDLTLTKFLIPFHISDDLSQFFFKVGSIVDGLTFMFFWVTKSLICL